MHKLPCQTIVTINSAEMEFPEDMRVQIGAQVTLADVMRYDPENIHNEFGKRDADGLALTKDRNAICTFLLERTWLTDGHANKQQSIGPMLYAKAYKKVKTIFRSHSAAFEDTFDKCLALVGEFDTIESINVTGGNRMCGKTMVVRICVERDAGVADRLRGGLRRGVEVEGGCLGVW